ncbi:MAG: DUF2339 domain-containing protein [Caulobacterales bacterium]
MGAIIIILAALAAFGVGAAITLLYVLWRRSEQHRDALLEAYVRVDKLERTMAAVTFGETPLQVQATPQATPIEDSTPETPIIEAPPQSQQAAAAPDPIQAEAARVILEPPPPPPLAPHFPPRALKPVLELTHDDSVEARIARANAVPEPPRADFIAAGAALIAFVALIATRLDFISPLAGPLIAGLAGGGAIFGAEWRRRQSLEPAPLLVSLGLALIAIAIAISRTDRGGLPPIAALTCGGALALGALHLAIKHRSWLVFTALAIGLAAPLLAPYEGAAAHVRHGMLFALAAFAGAFAHERNEPLWAWLAFTGALAWGAVSALTPLPPFETAGAGAFFAGLAALGFGYGWSDARTPAPQTIADMRHREPLTVALLVSASTTLLALINFYISGASAMAAAFGVGTLAAFASIASIYRRGFAPVALFAAIVAAIALAIWPEAGLVPAALLGAAAVLALIFAFAGGAMLPTQPITGAMLMGAAPVALIVGAQARVSAFAEPWIWACGAGAFLLLDLLAFTQLRKPQPRGAAIFLMSAVLAATAAAGFLIPAPWPPIAVALIIPLIAWLDARFNNLGLRAAAMALSTYLLVHVTVMGFSDVNTATRGVTFAISALSIYAAARLFNARSARAVTTDVLFACAFICAALAFSVETRRWFAAAADDVRLLELGAHTLIWLALATVLSMRFGPKPRLVIYAIEAACFGAAAIYALAAGALVLNPWWGVAAAPAPGWPGFNILLLAYLAPAFAFAFYGRLQEQRGMTMRAAIALGVGLMLALLHVTLELRRNFHGAAMADGGVSISEGWAYSIGWLGFAGALVLLAMERNAGWLRHVALAVALLALAKAALFDLSGFSGLLQIALGAMLLAATAGVVFLYRRYVLLPPASEANTESEANAA